MPTADSVQNLYKSLLKYARQFPQYNFRNYALRKIKEDFSLAKTSLKSPEEISKFVKEKEESLEQLKRMIKVQSLYFDDSRKLIVEEGSENKDKQ